MRFFFVYVDGRKNATIFKLMRGDVVIVWLCEHGNCFARRQLEKQFSVDHIVALYIVVVATQSEIIFADQNAKRSVLTNKVLTFTLLRYF